MFSGYPTYLALRGKVAVVTGGSKGIDFATARLLAANGARVVVNGLPEDTANAAVFSLVGCHLLDHRVLDVAGGWVML